MKLATIDHAEGVFHAEITESGRVVALRSVSTYREAIAATTGAGVSRGNVTLTPTARVAAASACFGGSA